MSFAGQGIPKDNKKAEEYYVKAEEKGDKQAKVNLGELYREGGFGIKQDYDKALYWYKLGIADEPERAYNGLAEMYFAQGNNEKGEENIIKAANLGYTEAQYNLGVLYDQGLYDVKPNQEKAKYWYEKAAKNGSILAQENLQILLESNKQTN